MGGLRELWPDFIDAAKELPNLFICLSGPTQWGIQSLYDALGPEKLLLVVMEGADLRQSLPLTLRRIDLMDAPKRIKE